MEYWKNLEKIAKDNNLNTLSFGKKTNLSPQYLFMAIKHHYLTPSAHTVQKISRAFNLKPTDVYSDGDDSFFANDNLKYRSLFWDKFINPKLNKYLTVTRIAKESGVSRVYLSGLKNGYIPFPNPRVVILLAKYFQASSVHWFEWIQRNMSSLDKRMGDLYDEEIEKAKSER